MTTSQHAEALGRVSLFSDLTGKQLEAIANAAKEIERGTGEVLAKEGDTGIGFFLILEGTAQVDVGGDPKAELGPGDSFGEISLLDGGPRTATVTATSQMRLLGLTAWAFKAIVKEHPELAVRLLEVLAGYLRDTVKTDTLDA